MTDPNSNTTTMYCDDLGRVTRVTNALSKDTYLYYAGGCAGCSGGQLTKVKDALNNETDYAYDCMGRVTRVTLPSVSGNTVYMLTDRKRQSL